MSQFLDVKVNFEFGDSFTPEQVAIVNRHLEAMSLELGEAVGIYTYLTHRLYPDGAYRDGDDPWAVDEAYDLIREGRKHDKIVAMRKRLAA